MRRARKDGTGNALDLQRSGCGPSVGQSPVSAFSSLLLNYQRRRRAAYLVRLDQKSKTKRNLTAISGCHVASRAARPAWKGRKGGPQLRGDEEGAGDALSSSQRPRRPGDGRVRASPFLGGNSTGPQGQRGQCTQPTKVWLQSRPRPVSHFRDLCFSCIDSGEEKQIMW